MSETRITARRGGWRFAYVPTSDCEPVMVHVVTLPDGEYVRLAFRSDGALWRLADAAQLRREAERRRTKRTNGDHG